MVFNDRDFYASVSTPNLTPPPAGQTSVDLQAVITHEYGHYFGLDHTLITAAAERNPDKWGKVTVGTHIPIVSEEEARAAKPDYFVVLPWHFIEEFKARERAYLRAGGRFIVPMPHFTLI